MRLSLSLPDRSRTKAKISVVLEETRSIAVVATLSLKKKVTLSACEVLLPKFSLSCQPERIEHVGADNS